MFGGEKSPPVNSVRVTYTDGLVQICLTLTLPLLPLFLGSSVRLLFFCSIFVMNPS